MLLLSAACFLATFSAVSLAEIDPATEVARQPAAEAVDLDDPDREVLPDVIEQVEIDQDPWVQRVEEMTARIGALESSPEDADALFVELGSILRERLDLLAGRIGKVDSVMHAVEVPRELSGFITTLQDLHRNVQRLYALRTTLMQFVSPDLEAEITGTKLFGAQELRTEAKFAWQTIRYQLFELPVAWDVITLRLERSPLRFITDILQLVLVFFLFSWWRHWFPDTLASMRRSLMMVRPRGAKEINRLKLIWYIEQVRSPVEWLVVIQLLGILLPFDTLSVAKDIVFIVVRWLLVARIIVLLINAFAARGDVGLAGDEGSLRLRSLRLLSAWLLTLGIGLSLAGYLTGEGAVYAAIWRVFKILSLPVAVILLGWWKERIFERLALESGEAGQFEGILQRRDGIRGLFNAASGLGHLVASEIQKTAMRRAGVDDALVDALQSKVVDAATGVPADVGDPEATRALREVLVQPVGLYAKYARTERRQLVQRINSSVSGIAIVVGERGTGKTRFLESLEDKIESSLLFVDCRAATGADFLTLFCQSLGLGPGAKFDPREMRSRLEDKGVGLVAVDNIHRLLRPVIGGQGELDNVISRLQELDFPGTWLYTVDRHTWRYLLAAQPKRAIADTILELPPWTEEQIADYIQQRCEEMNIEPDFSAVSVPRQFLDAQHSSPSERNRAGVIRMLVDYAEGNISVAMRLFAECLAVEKSGAVEGALPCLASSVELEALPLDSALVLRVIAQFEGVHPQDIQAALRVSPAEVHAMLRLARMRGWIEDNDGRLDLHWRWRPVIVRMLARQNLLSR